MRSSQIKFAKLRALVVSDNQFTCTLTQSMLRNIGMEMIFEARSGALAIDQLASLNLDFMLLDWHMDDVNGAGVLQILRNPNFGRNFDLPVIVTSDNVTRRLITRAKECGAAQIAAKPLSAAQLKDAILKILTSKKQTHKEPKREWVPEKVLPTLADKPVKEVTTYADDVLDDVMDQFFVI